MENILPDERYLFIQDLSNLVTHLEQGYKSTSEDWNKCEGVLTKLYESTVRLAHQENLPQGSTGVQI